MLWLIYYDGKTNIVQETRMEFSESDSDQCHCDQGSQTPQHILLQCPLYTELRKQLLEKLSQIEVLQYKLADYDAIISDPQAICYVAKFIHRRGLLGQFRATVLEPEPQGDKANTEHESEEPDISTE